MAKTAAMTKPVNVKKNSELAIELNADSRAMLEATQQTLDEVNKKSSGVDFKMDFETGELTYESDAYTFNVNTETGNLEWEVI